MRVAFQLEATKKEIIKKSETAEYLKQQVRLIAFHQGPPNFKLMYVFFLINQVTLWICKDTARVILHLKFVLLSSLFLDLFPLIYYSFELNIIKQVQQFKEEKEKAIQDKETVQKESEKQMNELCATLEKYKVD